MIATFAHRAPRAAWLVFGAAALAACGGKPTPVIESFASNRTEVASGEQITLSWSVKDAERLELEPGGDVTGQTGASATVSTTGPNVFTLRAINGDKRAEKQVTVNVSARVAAVVSFNATPSQVEPGGTVTLQWATLRKVTSLKITADQGASPGEQAAESGSVTVNPTQSTTYTLSVTGDAGTAPATASVLVRVAPAPSVATFTATPATSLQGEAVVLAWSGDAVRWSLKDDATGVVTQMGPARTLTVRPNTTRTYTLTAVGPTGTTTRQVTVTVTANAGTVLHYDPPGTVTGPVRMEVASGNDTATIELRLVANGAQTARALALNLPLDAQRVELAATGGLTWSSAALDAGTAGDATPDAAAAAISTLAPAVDVLTVGVAQKNNTSRSLPDGTVIATLKLNKKAGAGKGVVFDGASLGPRYRALLRDAPGVPGAPVTPTPFAIGRLEVR